MPSRLLTGSAVLWALIVVLVAFTWMPTSVSSPNERSRIYLTLGLVDHHTVAIDRPIAEFGSIYDCARRGNRFYSDKAPGMSLAAAVPYGLARLVWPRSAFTIERLLTLSRLFMLPVTALGLLWMRRLLRVLGVRAALADACVIVWVVGTAVFPVAYAFVGHQVVSVCLLGALLAVYSAQSGHPVKSDSNGGVKVEASANAHLRTRFLLAGALAGMALLTEYQSAVPVALLGLFVTTGPPRTRVPATCAFALGLVPFVLALGVYNTLAFGGPFKLSYHFLADPALHELHTTGIGGVALPSVRFLVGGLVSLHRGLFATSPLFLLGFPGVVYAFRRDPRLAWLCVTVWFYYVYLISSTAAWQAGWGYGPRLVVPGLSFALILVALAVETMALRAWGTAVVLGLGLYGVVTQQVVRLVIPSVPDAMKNPLVDLIVPALRARVLSPNLVTRFWGAPAGGSLAVMAAMTAGVVGWCTVLFTRDLSHARARVTAVVGAVGVALPFVLAVVLVGNTAGQPYSAHVVEWLRAMTAADRAFR